MRMHASSKASILHWRTLFRVHVSHRSSKILNTATSNENLCLSAQVSKEQYPFVGRVDNSVGQVCPSKDLLTEYVAIMQHAIKVYKHIRISMSWPYAWTECTVSSSKVGNTSSLMKQASPREVLKELQLKWLNKVYKIMRIQVLWPWYCRHLPSIDLAYNYASYLVHTRVEKWRSKDTFVPRSWFPMHKKYQHLSFLEM